MPRDPSKWLSLTVEDPIEPERRICDPHHHLWDRPEGPYCAAEWLADCSGAHAVRSTVFVECGAGLRTSGPEAMRPIGETDFVRAEAETADRLAGGQTPVRVAAGVVGFANLLLGREVEDVLAAHVAASPAAFRGIRHSAAWDPDPRIRRSHAKPPPRMLEQGAFREGFACLAPRGLHFDAWLFHPQIPELTDLAYAFPETAIVLDHVGGPLGIGPYEGRRDEVFELWQENLAALAHCPNVTVKLGGLTMPICGFGWHLRDAPPGSAELADTFAPWYLHCIRHFGADRCMFESNFPVDKASCSYPVLWNAFKRIAADLGEAERDALFYGTAARVYRLGEAG